MPANKEEQLRPLMTHQPLSHARGTAQKQRHVSGDFSSPLFSNNPLRPSSAVTVPPGQRMDPNMPTYPETPIMGVAMLALQQTVWDSQPPTTKTSRARVASMSELEKLERRREQNRNSQAKLRMNRETKYRIASLPPNADERGPSADTTGRCGLQVRDARDNLAEQNLELRIMMNTLTGELAFWHERELVRINSKREKHGLPVFSTFQEMVQTEKELAHGLSESRSNVSHLKHNELWQENQSRRSSGENSGDIVSDELKDSSSALGSSCSPTHASIILPPHTTAGNHNTLDHIIPAYMHSAMEISDPYATPVKTYYRAVNYTTPTSSEKTGKRRRVVSPSLEIAAEEMSDTMFFATPGLNLGHGVRHTQTSARSQALDAGSYFARDAPSSSGCP